LNLCFQLVYILFEVVFPIRRVHTVHIPFREHSAMGKAKFAHFLGKLVLSVKAYPWIDSRNK